MNNNKIAPLNPHYSIQNLPTIFDEEALTVLELVGRIAGKVNEVIQAQNGLDAEVIQTLQEQDAILSAAIAEQERYLQEHVSTARTLFSDASTPADANIMEPGDYITAAGECINLPEDAQKQSGFLSVRVSETEAMRYWVKQEWTSYSTGATYARIYSRSTETWTPWEPISNRICKVYSGYMDELKESGYYVCDGVVGSPYRMTTNGICLVRSTYNPNDREGGRNAWVEQTYFSTYFPTRYAKRFCNNGVWGEWIYSGGGELLYETDNLDNVTREGCFTVPPALVPKLLAPFKDSDTYGFLNVRRFDGQGENYWVTQELTILPYYRIEGQHLNPFRLYRSYYSSTNKWSAWSDGSHSVTSTYAAKSKADNLFRMNGRYWIPNSDPDFNTPNANAGVLTVEVFNHQYHASALVKQTFTRYNNATDQVLEEWVRFASVDRNADKAEWRPWRKVGSHVANKSIVCLGDSIIGSYEGNFSVCDGIREATGATVYNCAFGGTRYKKHANDVNMAEFDFYNVATAIKNGDFSKMETALANMEASGQLSAGQVEIYQNHIAELKAIDFTRVDFIVMHYGTNDWYNEECELGPIESIGGLSSGGMLDNMRAGIRTINSVYNNIRFIVCTPIVRFEIGSDGSITGQAHNMTKSMGTLPEVVKAIKDTCAFNMLPCVDLYQIGINSYNCEAHFQNGDGVHPIGATRKMLGYRIGNYINNL